ncbi:hypothetical protein TYRP_020074 [Tyrophagus putrescentiae]|nr:hypothetical protein TYRP_020074 [Tyrophagus putrescentiae]
MEPKERTSSLDQQDNCSSDQRLLPTYLNCRVKVKMKRAQVSKVSGYEGQYLDGGQPPDSKLRQTVPQMGAED